jgi:DNA-binding FrmR family transcriptional regulator
MTTIERSTATEIAESQHGYISDKKRYLDRLKRIEGQARGIHRMVEEEQYCIDILTQISALTSALEGVALRLLDDHLKHCVADAARLGEPHSDFITFGPEKPSSRPANSRAVQLSLTSNTPTQTPWLATITAVKPVSATVHRTPFGFA